MQDVPAIGALFVHPRKDDLGQGLSTFRLATVEDGPPADFHYLDSPMSWPGRKLSNICELLLHCCGLDVLYVFELGDHQTSMSNESNRAVRSNC